MTITNKEIEQHEKDLEKLHDQRRMWLWASSIVFWALIFIIFAWDWIDGFGSKSVWWLIVSCMLIVSINWWYWSMRVVRKLIVHQTIEYGILKSILGDVSEVKKSVRELGARNIDIIK